MIETTPFTDTLNPTLTIKDDTYTMQEAVWLMNFLEKEIRRVQIEHYPAYGRSEEPCNHRALIDTGLGYYYCPACKEPFRREEYLKMSLGRPEETNNL